MNIVSATSSASASTNAATTANTSNIQKKFFDYAKNYAMEKIHKKLDESLTKKGKAPAVPNASTSAAQPVPTRSNSVISIQLLAPPQQQQHQQQPQTHTFHGSIQNIDYAHECQPLTMNSSPDHINTSDDDKQLSSEKLKFCRIHQKNLRLCQASNCEYSKYLKNIGNSNKSNSKQNLNTKTNRPLSFADDDDYQTADEDEENCLEIQMEDEQNTVNQNKIRDKDCEQPLLNSTGQSSKLPSDIPSPGTPNLPISAVDHGSKVDISGYIQKKSLAQGMMDLALVSANTNQLRYILEYHADHPYFVTSLALVISSLFLQLAVGLGLIWNSRLNVKKRKEMKEADRFNNFSVIGIFMITLINVFLSTFGGAPQSASTLPPPPIDHVDVGGMGPGHGIITGDTSSIPPSDLIFSSSMPTESSSATPSFLEQFFPG